MRIVAGLTLTTGVAVLLSCSSPQFGASAPQHTNLVVPAKSTKGDLVYVSGSYGPGPIVYMVTFPQGKPHGRIVGNLTGVGPSGECVDAAGDIFIMSYNSSQKNSTVYEYAHAGTSPIATLNDPGVADGCSVDPTSGNLAVANSTDTTNSDNGNGDIAVYAQAQGQPTMYRLSGYGMFYFPGYDDRGNLYGTAHTQSGGPVLIGLPSGSGAVESINLNIKLHDGIYFHPAVQWDGKHMTVSSFKAEGHNAAGIEKVYRFIVSGSSATVVGKTTLTFCARSQARNVHGRNVACVNRVLGQTWIDRNTIVGFNIHAHTYLCYWAYPKGGPPESWTRLSPHGTMQVVGATVSAAQ